MPGVTACTSFFATYRAARGGRRAGASRGLRVRVARSLEVGELVVAADIVHLAVHALVHDRVKRVSDVRHKDEVSRVGAVSVDANLLGRGGREQNRAAGRSAAAAEPPAVR